MKTNPTQPDDEDQVRILALVSEIHDEWDNAKNGFGMVDRLRHEHADKILALIKSHESQLIQATQRELLDKLHDPETAKKVIEIAQKISDIKKQNAELERMSIEQPFTALKGLEDSETQGAE